MDICARPVCTETWNLLIRLQEENNPGNTWATDANTHRARENFRRFLADRILAPRPRLAAIPSEEIWPPQRDVSGAQLRLGGYLLCALGIALAAGGLLIQPVAAMMATGAAAACVMGVSLLRDQANRGGHVGAAQ